MLFGTPFVPSGKGKGKGPRDLIVVDDDDDDEGEGGEAEGGGKELEGLLDTDVSFLILRISRCEMCVDMGTVRHVAFLCGYR